MSSKIVSSDSNAHLPGVDLIKYIMAFAVVAIHFEASEGAGFTFPPIIKWLNAAAVPFFFLCSGFLLRRKLASIDLLQERKAVIFKRVRKLLRLWCCWLLICLPMTVYALRNDTLSGALKTYFFQLGTRGWELHAAPLWFLYSMIWIFLAIALLQTVKNYKAILLSLFMVIGFSNRLSTHSNIALLLHIKTLTGNTLGGGIPILAGMFLYEYRHRITILFSVLTLILSLTLFFLDLPYSNHTAGITFFSLALQLPLKSSGTLLGLRAQSMWIYYTHEFVLFLLFSILGLRTAVAPYPLIAIAFGLAAGLAYILFRLQRHPKCGFIRFLVS